VAFEALLSGYNNKAVTASGVEIILPRIYSMSFSSFLHFPLLRERTDIILNMPLEVNLLCTIRESARLMDSVLCPCEKAYLRCNVVAVAQFTST
jgi:hypothetical protein